MNGAQVSLQYRCKPRRAPATNHQSPITQSLNTNHSLPHPPVCLPPPTLLKLKLDGVHHSGSWRNLLHPLQRLQRHLPHHVSQDHHGELSRRPTHVQPRYRGIHVLQRDENGYEKCVGCFLCAAACPANCIYIEAAENTDANRISAGERYAKVYNIDYSRCIFCGYCVEACPTDAITHGHSIELAPYDINALIYRKEQLLEPWPPRTSTKP